MQLKIRNDFDPVLSPESSLFVLKSNKQVTVSSSAFVPNSYCTGHSYPTVFFTLSIISGGISRHNESA